jgi:hypothetical protein
MKWWSISSRPPSVTPTRWLIGRRRTTALLIPVGLAGWMLDHDVRSYELIRPSSMSRAHKVDEGGHFAIWGSTKRLEQVASVRLGDPARTRQLRHRYLRLLLDGLHSPSPEPLAGPPPTWQEVTGRWDPGEPVSDRPLRSYSGTAERLPWPPVAAASRIAPTQSFLPSWSSMSRMALAM